MFTLMWAKILTIVMPATGLCFAEKNIYTQEVLAVVIQLLAEENPMPTLLMRTVMQTLSLYPRLVGFVMNILQRLIPKQVWKQKKIWEGFLMCCQRTMPQSFPVLFQLPIPQLRSVISSHPELHAALREHVQSLPESQSAHIAPSIVDTIFSHVTEETATE
jgi:symplekin